MLFHVFVAKVPDSGYIAKATNVFMLLKYSSKY